MAHRFLDSIQFEPIIPTGDGDIELFYLPLASISARHLSIFETQLTESENVRLARYKSPQAAIQFLACRAVLRILLGLRLNQSPIAVEIMTDKHGKPFVNERPVTFNISHSMDFAVFALSGSEEIGVDIEIMDSQREWQKLAKRYFSPCENSFFTKNIDLKDQLKMFYRGWTRKEALLKAAGKGITVDLKAFDVSLGEKATLMASRIPELKAHEWQFSQMSWMQDILCTAHPLSDLFQNYEFALASQKSENQPFPKCTNSFLIRPI